MFIYAVLDDTHLNVGSQSFISKVEAQDLNSALACTIACVQV